MPSYLLGSVLALAMEGHVTPLVHVRDPESIKIAIQMVRNALKEAQKGLGRAEDLNRACNGFMSFELKWAQDRVADLQKKVSQIESLQSLQLAIRPELFETEPNWNHLFREED